jgi:hypothetical protein
MVPYFTVVHFEIFDFSDLREKLTCRPFSTQGYPPAIQTMHITTETVKFRVDSRLADVDSPSRVTQLASGSSNGTTKTI